MSASSQILIQKDSNEYYHSQKEYISASGLKTISLKSPFHFFNSITKDTPALAFGSAYHDYNLEEELFNGKYWVLDVDKRPELDKTLASTLNKAWKAAEESANAGKTLLTPEDFEKLQAMRVTMRENKNIVALLSGGVAELSHYLEDFDGAKVRVRPDYLKTEKGIIIDLKTCEDASPEGFSRTCANFGYHIQAAFYADTMEYVYGKPFQMVFIAQEKTYPFACQIYPASEKFMAQGRYEYGIALQLYKKALETGEYKGYEVRAEPGSHGIIELDLPNWAYRESSIII